MDDIQTMNSNSFARRKAPFLLLVLPTIFYLMVVFIWQSHDLYKITGDEPHYLFIADSLSRDLDLTVANNYSIETPVHQATRSNYADPEDMNKHVLNGYSLHNIGLGFILAIPYKLAGVVGAKAAIALLVGLCPFLFYRTLFRITESKPWSLLVAFAVAIGLPFAAASNQIYPDLLGGMIIFWGAERIIRLLQDKDKQSVHSSLMPGVLFGLLISLLPWLHIRLAAPATLLLLGYVYVAVYSQPSLTADSSRRYKYLVPVAIVACSLLLLGFYNRHAFGSIFGPYQQGALGFDVKKMALVFFGLHGDKSQGMFMQQPLLLLGLFGIVPLIKANRQAAFLLGMIYFSILLPNSMHSVTYGGFSFVGRFGWAAVSLWIFPIAYAVKLLLEQNKQAMVLLLCIATIILQGWFASQWLLHHEFLMNSNDIPVWSARSFYDGTWLWRKLPAFQDVDAYLKHPPNYVVLLLLILLTVSGWLWQRGAKRLLGKVWVIFLILGVSIIKFIPPAYGSWWITPDRLPGITGSVEGTSRRATEGTSKEGHLIFGQYIKMREGSYEAAVEYESSNASRLPVARFDVVYDQGIKVIEGDLPPSSTNNGVFTFKFSVDASVSLSKLFECRIWYPGYGDLRVKRLTITPLRLR